MDLLLEERKLYALLMWLALPSSHPFVVFSVTLPHCCFKAVYKHKEIEKRFPVFIQTPKPVLLHLKMSGEHQVLP